MSAMDEVIRAVLAQVAVFTALLLFASALHKILGWSRAQRSARDLLVMSRRPAGLMLAGAAFCEFAAAALLVTTAHREAGAVLAAVTWGAYLFLIVRAIVEGRREVDCGCTFGPSTRPLGAFQAARSGVLTGLALLVAAASARLGSIAIEPSMLLPACALLALYGALDQVLGLGPLRSGATS